MSLVIVILISPLLLLGLLWFWKELTMGMVLSQTTTMADKNVLITGGTAGIGFETALEIARRGASLIITGRNVTKGQEASKKIIRMSDNPKVVFKQLDLTSQADVIRFAGEVLSTVPKLHCLINNAGTLGDYPSVIEGRKPVRTETADGFELVMATNFLGHVTLTEALMKIITSAGSREHPSRIIHVSSAASITGRLDPSNWDLNMKRGEYSASLQYSNSKLAQVLYSNELNRRTSSTVESVSLHPGAVRTEIMRDFSSTHQMLISALFYVLGKSSWQGAQTTIHLALADKAEEVGGKFYSDCRPWWLSHSRFANKLMGDRGAEVKLYREARRMLQLDKAS